MNTLDDTQSQSDFSSDGDISISSYSSDNENSPDDDATTNNTQQQNTANRYV